MQSKIFAFIKLYPFITLSSLFLQNKTTVFWTLSFFLENPTVAVSVRKTPDGQTLRAWADRRLASSAPLSPRPPRSNPAPGHRAPAARWWPTPLQWPREGGAPGPPWRPRRRRLRGTRHFPRCRVLALHRRPRRARRTLARRCVRSPALAPRGSSSWCLVSGSGTPDLGFAFPLVGWCPSDRLNKFRLMYECYLLF